MIAVGCENGQDKKESLSEISDINPPASGFDSINSDPKAIAWADATMKAMGGRKKWDNTRYLAWNFFDRRDLIWDKYTGNVRIEVPQDSIIYLTNINDNTGKVRIKGRQVQESDSIKNLMKRAKSIWINDSYWLVMPFKLKDSGVTLNYLREDTTLIGAQSHVLGLTFNEVGDTPNNGYEIYITKSDSLVKQWAFFGNAAQDSASAIWPWDNYQNYNGLLLSADRSDGLGPHDVQVYESLSEEAFTDFDWKMTE
ncbi:hypothetical protein JR347_03730 [Fulvivirga lutea]|uniref:Uncharacterized protein n=1 Tax=Fulvivirga lutea TaxID=2810512 RepID=A0A974WK74_9BACT|nr:hypothetical protein JR347_03730 [Fulvivirga lutea]